MVEIQEPTVIERPLAAVWNFCIVHHIENHPRWDPSVELEAPSDDPTRVGSVITRRTTRFGTTTEGTMEILLAAISRAGKTVIWWAVASAVVAFAQPIWVTSFRGKLACDVDSLMSTIDPHPLLSNRWATMSMSTNQEERCSTE